MFKRVFDFAVAALALLLLSPLLAVLALLIKLDSPGPVMFRQERVGRHGKVFRIFKFRTMVQAQAPGAPQLTVGADHRITRTGTWMRRHKLDELPQLLDVLRGTMSLVGPRPEVPKYVQHYPAGSRERVLSVRPGITDFASVHYRNEGELLAQAADPEQEYLNRILPFKLRYALHYVDRQSAGDDLRVLGLTLRTVFTPSFSRPGRWLAMNDSKIWGRLDRAMSSMHPRRRIVASLVDAITVLACWHVTYLFRLGFERYEPGRPWYDDYVSVGVVLVYLASLGLFGVGRGIWRYFCFDDLQDIAFACLLAGVICAAAVSMAQLTGVARAVLVLHPVFCIAMLSVVRMACRLVWEHARAQVNGQHAEPRRAVVLGAGGAARRLIAGIHLRDGWTVLALLDDDLTKRGARIGGVPVLGPLTDLALPHVHAEATHVIVAMPGATDEQRSRAFLLAKEVGLAVLTVPSQHELQRERTLPATQEVGGATGRDSDVQRS